MKKDYIYYYYYFICFLFTLTYVLGADNSGCCSPIQWSIQGQESNSLGVIDHHIYYDAENQIVRWDRVGFIETNKYDHLITYSIYQKGIEWLYYPRTNVCEAYGPDQFTAWCYGPRSVGQNFVANIDVAGSACTMWNNPQNSFTWISSDANCFPVSTFHNDDNVVFYNATIGVDPATLVPPAVCHLNSDVKLSQHPSSWMRSLHSGKK